MKILIATGNEGKKKEMLEFFSSIQEKVTFLSLNDFPTVDDLEENGKTFEENALLKAQYFGKKFQIPTIGEDSGLILEAFPKKFGLKTKREISASSDEEWLEIFLKMLENQPNRNATFYSAMAFFDPKTNTSKTFLGTTSGTICEKPEAELEKGIPVSAVFICEGETKVFSAMTRAEKNRISHRGKSVKKMVDFLGTLL